MDAKTIFIHPTSVVEPGAKLGLGVRVGPFCHIGPNVELGDNSELLSHVSLTGHTIIGENAKLHPHSAIGGDPQNASYKGELTYLRIGKNVTIREGVTVHAGTGNSRGETVIGDNCMFLAYSHVGHDCTLGNNVTMANNVMLAGHCTVGNNVIIGGGAGIHQFCNVGHHAFIGAVSAVASDVIPYGMIVGNRGYLGGLNIVGMKRSGMPRVEIHAVRAAYRAIFNYNSGKTVRENALEYSQRPDLCAPVKDVIEFVLKDKKRQLMTPISSRKSRDVESL